MTRGLSSVSFFLIVVSLLLSLVIMMNDLSSAEARSLKISRSNKDHFMVKEIERTVSMAGQSTPSTTSAPSPDRKRHKFHSVKTLKWSKNSGPAPGEGHKIDIPAGGNQ